MIPNETKNTEQQPALIHSLIIKFFNYEEVVRNFLIQTVLPAHQNIEKFVEPSITSMLSPLYNYSGRRYWIA